MASSRNRVRSKMPFSSPDLQQAVANRLLKDAMKDERSKRWTKVVQSYRRLLRMLNKENLPQDFVPPQWFNMLLYECHYHLGLALQNIGEHKRAVSQYTQALEAIFISKNGCEAGCHTNSCLMIPLYARRSFAYCKAGDLKSGLKDAERTVVLDSKNPDVYCIRALVRSTRQEHRLARSDIETALTYNCKHLCALILRGSLDRPIADDWEEMSRPKLNTPHQKACSINPDCHNYLSVQDFHHPEIISFYDRFLYSLNVPHTIHDIDLVSIIPTHLDNSVRTIRSRTPSSAGSRPSTRQSSVHPSCNSIRNRPPSPITGRNQTDDLSIYSKTLVVTQNPLKFKQQSLWTQDALQPFRCGTVEKSSKAQDKLNRRKEYGLAVQEFVNRPKTAADYMTFLEKERQKRDLEEQKQNRAKSATSFKSETNAESDRISASLRTNLTFDGSHKKTSTNQTIITSQPATVAHRQKIKAFEKVHVNDAPRMYYRPWHGDKLPVAEIEKKESISPPFRP